jgi:hypothetical protein
MRKRVDALKHFHSYCDLAKIFTVQAALGRLR